MYLLQYPHKKGLEFKCLRVQKRQQKRSRTAGHFCYEADTAGWLYTFPKDKPIRHSNGQLVLLRTPFGLTGPRRTQWPL